MSLDFVEHGGRRILFLNLEAVTARDDKLRHVEDLNNLASGSEGGLLLLVKVKDFLPGPGFLETAATTLGERARKLRKVAYVGLGERNRRLYEAYDRFTPRVVLRRVFETEAQAIEWLLAEDCPEDRES